MKVWDRKLDREVDVGEADAQAGILAGLYATTQTDQYIVDEHGNIGEAAPSELPHWFGKGHRLASDEDIARYKARDSGGSAFALGVVDGITFGTANMITQAAESMGVVPEGTAAQATYLREENQAFNIAGQLLPMALAGPASAIRGVGMVSKAGQALTAAPRAIRSAGQAATSMLGQTATKKGLGAQAARLSTEGAVEGAAHGFIQGMSEADFGDLPVAAEQILGAIGVGALTGAAAGGAIAPLGAAFKAGKRNVAKGLESLYESVAGTPAIKGYGKKAEGWLRARQKQFNPGDEMIIDELANKQRRAVLADPQLVPKTARKLTKEMVEADALTDELVRGGLAGAKTKTIGRKIKAPNAAKTVAWGQRLVNEFEKIGTTIPGAKGKQLMRLADEARFAAHGGDPIKTFKAMDALKRNVDEMINWKGIKTRQAMGLQGINPAAEEIEQVLIRANDAVRLGLEAPELWGKEAAGIQARTNGMLSKLRESGGDWRKHFTVKHQGAYTIDPTKVESFLKDTQGLRNDLRGSVLQDRIKQQREISELLRGGYDLSPALAKQVSKLEATTAGLEASLKTAGTDIARSNQAKAMAQGTQVGPLGQLANSKLNQTLGGLYAGGITGMLAARAVGEGISAIANPARFYLNMAKAEQLRSGLNAHVGARIKDFFATVVKYSPTGLAIRKGAPLVQRARTPMLVALARGDNQAKNAAYVEATTQLQMVAQNPDIINQQVLDSLGPMQEVAPQLASELSTRLLANAQWMLDHTEQPANWPTMFGEPPGLSDFELQRFEQQLAISEDPLHALDLLAEDKLTVTDVEALKGMWPSIYNQVSRTLLEEIEADSERQAIPYNKRIQVGILLDVPTDPTMIPEQVLKSQQTVVAISAPPEEGAPGNFSAKAVEGVQREGTTMDQQALREA